VKQIFECPVPPDGPVILVDDVVTTGATLEACIKTLNSKGVNDITVLSFAAARIEKG
jgi:predicted amidophosphoribosyltransferase